MLRKIPSDPAVDRRSFGFSPSPISFTRYLAEGRQPGRQSPKPRSYNARQAPAAYPHSYRHGIAEAFPYDDPGAPARIGRKSCRCQHQCGCNHVAKKHKQQQSDAPSSMWRKDSCTESNTPSRPGLLGGEASRSGRATPSGVSVSAASESAVSVRDAVVELRPPAPKKSDWENLLGAVDLELRAQRAEFVPKQAPAPVPRFTPAAARAPLHPSVGDNLHTSGSSVASVSPDLRPQKPTHRRGGEVVSGGGPAYSGSTADAACLLATLPQRMLDRASVSPAAKPAAVVMPSPALVSAVSPAAVASAPPAGPARVQAAGRRGPRGQSRFKGVCITRAGKWRAVIYIGRKQKYLGVFDSEFDAARAYDVAALEHFAEGAKLNFPDGIEQQLNDLSSGCVSRSFSTAGAGGAAAARSETPPALDCAGSKRSRKSAFGEHDDDEWVRDDGPWNSSRR